MARNLLTDTLPTTLTLDGKKYPIHTDFRRWIIVTELFSDDDVPAGVKAGLAGEILFSGENPVSASGGVRLYAELVREISRFISCGRNTENSEKSANAERVFDFTADSERIYAAFMQVYGIDLCDPSVTLHFLKFMALLRSLPRDTEFMRVIELRCTDVSGIENDELRRRIRRARASVRIRKDKNTGGGNFDG